MERTGHRSLEGESGLIRKLTSNEQRESSFRHSEQQTR